MSINGLKYEVEIYENLKKFEHISQDFCVLGDKPSGGFNAHDVDMSFNYKENVYNLEIKMSGKDQMGGTSFSYNIENELFESIKPIDKQTHSLIISSLQPLRENINEFITYIRNHSIEYNKSNVGFPIRTIKESWEDAKKNGLLTPLNTKVMRDTSFIHEHYAKKNVYYIQIGSMGLFYLKENPLNLNIPQLDGEINLEIRAGRSGSKKRLYEGNEYKFISGGLRVQGRLKFNGKSNYNLENIDDLKKLFV